ncbi:UbiA family prenyltransferase [Nitratireductor thuwali]|uniref:Decaprenyl-phosphate phosphoribosyltransferase n=1 Tax=Nitratireductor thuwali TaxID=2267699 RepID=A0ABY5MFU0_9HYPH|nr:Decaprenyl-phosphate phosphoribosyltransferase [Nitratireductor thuwali]
MDARSERIAVPLAVDLDGTLIAADLLWESLFLLIRKRPLCLFLLPLWLMKGRAHLKCRIAERIDFDPAALPYRAELLAKLQEEKAAGRYIVLATASPRLLAEKVAAHLGVFDQVLCTDPHCNMASVTKRDALVAAFGDGGFDYAGNSKADLKVFEAARQAVVVAPDRAASVWQAAHGGELIAAPKVSMRTIAKMLRVHQWLKNALIFVPLVLAHQYGNPPVLLDATLAFIAFSAAASAIYILNDFFDLALDRRHATKRNRPLASGVLSIPFGLGAMAVLLLVAAGTAAFLPPVFAAVLALYLVTTTAYSIAVKRMLLVDVLMLAGLYTLRILAGCAATGIEVSFWLLAFSVFFFLSLALVKRYVELRSTEVPVGERLAGRGYRLEDQEIIAQAGMASAFSSALVLALYIQSDTIDALYTHPWLIWPLGPIVLYITMRIWILARRDEMHDDPIVFIIRDWRSQAVAGLGALLLFAAGL